jgi:hypothetical protein
LIQIQKNLVPEKTRVREAFHHDKQTGVRRMCTERQPLAEVRFLYLEQLPSPLLPTISTMFLGAIGTHTSSSSAPKLSLDFGFARFALFFRRVARVLGDSIPESLVSGSGEDALARAVGFDFRLKIRGVESDMGGKNHRGSAIKLSIQPSPFTTFCSDLG